VGKKRRGKRDLIGWSGCISRADLEQSDEADEPDQRDTSDGQKEPRYYMYHWLYLAFFTLSIEGGAQILLCFDDAQGEWMEKAVAEDPPRPAAHELAGCPHVLLPRIVEAVARVYDKALWGFRDPIRQVEKARKDPVTAGKDRRGGTTLGRDVDEITKEYSVMHELFRHLAHIRETLEAANNTMAAILSSVDGDADGPCEGPWDEEAYRRPDSCIRFWAMFLSNLELRANSFKERLENEISGAYHRANVLQLRQASELLQASQDEGKDIAKYVAYASMIFLPGTFVSGFFSMTIFGFVPDDMAWHQSASLWIYFLITVPMTVSGVIFVYLRHRHNQNPHDEPGNGPKEKESRRGELSSKSKRSRR